MDQLECIVSKCKNVIGVRMPCNNLNVRNFWASRLNLSDILTARDVMVCFYHYNLANLYQGNIEHYVWNLLELQYIYMKLKLFVFLFRGSRFYGGKL